MLSYPRLLSISTVPFARAAVAATPGTYNHNFDSDWAQFATSTGVLTNITSQYGDDTHACTGENGALLATNTQICMQQLSKTLGEISKNYDIINKAFGDSGTMTSWFLASKSDQKTQAVSNLQQNFNYLNTALTAMSTLIGGTPAAVNTALGQPSNGVYVSFNDAVTTTSTNLQVIGQYIEALKQLIPTIDEQYMADISSLQANMTNVIKAIDDDNSNVQSKVQTSYNFFKDLATTVVTDFASNISALDDEQNGSQGFVANITADIDTIRKSLKIDLASVGQWNKAQAAFIKTINQAILDANKTLPLTLKADYQIALGQESDSLSTNVINPAVLSFRDTATTYNTLASTLMSSAQTNVTNLINANQATINNQTDYLQNLTAYYLSLMDTMTNNIVNTASTSLNNANNTLNTANAAQVTWQTQMTGVLQNIAQSLGGVADAAASQDALAQSLAASVMMRFDRMISNLQKAAVKAGGNAAAALQQGSQVLVNSQSNTLAKLRTQSSKGVNAGTQASGDQLTVVSQSSVQMMGNLADMLSSLHSLMGLLQAQMGAATDSSNGALQLVNSVVTGNAQDLAQTISDISAKQQSDLLNAKASGMEAAADSSDSLGGIVDGVGAQAWRAVSGAQAMYSDVADASNQQINDLAAQIAAASDASSNLRDANNAIGSQTSSTVSMLTVNAAQLQTLLHNAVAAMGIALKGAQSSAMSQLDTMNHTLTSQLTSTASQTNATVVGLFGAYSDYLNTVNNSIFATPDANSISTGASFVSIDKLGPLLSNIVSSFQAESSSLMQGIDANLSAAVNDFSSIEAAAANADLTSITDMVDMMTNTTLVPNIANVQTASVAKFQDAVNSAYSILGDVSTAASNENQIYIQAQSLNDSSVQLALDIQSNIAYEKAQAAAVSAAALDAVKTETLRGLNASQDLDALIMSTQTEMQNLNNTVLSEIANTTVSIDMNAVVDRMNGFLGAVQAQQAQYFNITAQQAALRASIITDQQLDLQLLRSKEQIDLISAKSDYANKQSSILGVADQLANTLGELASLSGKNVSGLLSNLASIRAVSDNLSSSLQAYVSTTGARMRSETALAAQKLKQIAQANVMTRALAVTNMGNSMVSSMDKFNLSADSLENIASYNKGGLTGVAQMVSELNTSASIQLQMLLNQVESGKVSLQEALRTASQLNGAQLSTTSGIATEFTNIILSYIALTAQTFEDTGLTLERFNVSASQTIEEYTAALQESLDAVNALVQVGQTASESLKTDLQSALDTVSSSLKIEQGNDRDEALAAANATDYISQMLTNATAQFSSISKTEREAVASLTQWAQINIHDFLSGVAPSGTTLNVDSPALAWKQ